MIRLFHVSKVYARGERALDDITFSMEKGDFAFLTGPSGAGKTTLLRLLFAAERPTRGRVLVAGHDVSRLRASSVPVLRRNVGVVFQDFKLLPQRTVFDNVAFALEVLGRPRSVIRERVMTVLRQVGLGHRSTALPLRLSGGEKQRVAIARALVNQPAVLLADEPTGNLDGDLALEIMELFEAVNSRGTTVLFATHDRGLVERYTKRTLRLTQGRMANQA
jgi:cell division transport system ATP-binding protein